jgi:hypothetical protein
LGQSYMYNWNIFNKRYQRKGKYLGPPCKDEQKEINQKNVKTQEWTG